jgi:hypothetical protein
LGFTTVTEERSIQPAARSAWVPPVLSRVGTFAAVMKGGSLKAGEGGVQMMTKGVGP